MVAAKGMIRNNALVLERDDLGKYEGMNVIVTFIDAAQPTKKKKIDFSKYVTTTERGKNVEAYMEEMRADDRI